MAARTSRGTITLIGVLACIGLVAASCGEQEEAAPNLGPGGCVRTGGAEFDLANDAIRAYDEMVAAFDAATPPEATGFDFRGGPSVDYDAADLNRALAAKGARAQLIEVSQAEACDERAPSAAAILVRMGPVTGADVPDGYCDDLQAWLGTEGGVLEPTVAAPEEHRAVKARLDEIGDSGVVPGGTRRLVGPELIGVGVYAETNCDVEQAAAAAYGLILARVAADPNEGERQGDTGSSDTGGSGGSTGPSAELEDLCAKLREESPLPGLARVAPAELRPAAKAVEEYVKVNLGLFEADDPLEVDVGPLLRALMVDGIDESLASLERVFLDECDPDESSDVTLDPVISMADALTVEPTAEYCAALGAFFDTETTVTEALAGLPATDAVPLAHRELIDRITTVLGVFSDDAQLEALISDEERGAELADLAVQDLGTLGAYAEGVCEVPSAWVFGTSIGFSVALLVGIGTGFAESAPSDGSGG